jgi:hypothetical protein
VTRVVEDADVRQVVYDVYTSTGAFTSDDTLFEFYIERALHAKYGPRPSWPPKYTNWSSQARGAADYATFGLFFGCRGSSGGTKARLPTPSTRAQPSRVFLSWWWQQWPSSQSNTVM